MYTFISVNIIHISHILSTHSYHTLHSLISHIHTTDLYHILHAFISHIHMIHYTQSYHIITHCHITHYTHSYHTFISHDTNTHISQAQTLQLLFALKKCKNETLQSPSWSDSWPKMDEGCWRRHVTSLMKTSVYLSTRAYNTTTTITLACCFNSIRFKQLTLLLTIH